MLIDGIVVNVEVPSDYLGLNTHISSNDKVNNEVLFGYLIQLVTGAYLIFLDNIVFVLPCQ
jgi:hypothetical protein